MSGKSETTREVDARTNQPVQPLDLTSIPMTTT